MHETRIEYVQKAITIDIPKCDLCEREVSNSSGNGCPSEDPLLNIFIGYDTISRNMYGMTGQKYGIEGIELCVECRENWFKDILEMFPNAKKVKTND